jgi:outer membrane protein assembly factor BamB
LLARTPDATIGVEDAAGPMLFAQIQSVATDRTGNVYVLDAGSHSIRGFDRLGRHFASSGRSGRGPGDIGLPWAIAHDGDTSLVLVDQYNGVNLYTARTGTLRFERRLITDLDSRTACFLRGNLFIAGKFTDSLIQVRRVEGGQPRTFGRLFSADTNELVRTVINSGVPLITCSADADLVVVAEQTRDRVRAYTPAGQLVWEASLPDYNGTRVIPDKTRPRSFVTIYGPNQTAAIVVDGERILVSVKNIYRRRSTPAPGARLLTVSDSGITVYALDTRTGAVRSRERVQEIVAVKSNDRIVTYSDEPYPRVLIRAIR